MTEKRRLSVSVDADVAEAGLSRVAAGDSESLSAWVNGALRRQVEHDRRLRAMDEFIQEFEAEHGEITPKEMEEAHRELRGRATVVRAGVARRPA